MRPSTDVVLSALKRQFPALEPGTLVPFGEGMDFYAYELDGDTIVRVPRRKEVAAYLATEYRLLRLLGRRIRIGIPKPTLLGSPDRKLRFGFMGYPKIVGSSALRLGALLATLHRVAQRTVTRIGLRMIPVEQSLGDALTHARTDVRYLKRCQDQVPFGACQDYLSSFKSTPFFRGGGLSLTHGDLYPEHILLDGSRRRIVGIIDWADATFTDPAIDLAGAVYWGGLTFAQEVLRATDGRLDGKTMERAGFYAVCRALSDVKYGLHPQNAAYLRAAIAVLQRPDSFHRQ